MRRFLLSLGLAVSVSALSAGTALAQAPEGAQKAPIFGPNVFSSGFSCEGGAVATPKTFGFTVMDTPGNETTVNGVVALKRAAPKTEYFAEVVQNPPCAGVFAGTITTNKKGNGNLHFNVERIAGSTQFWILAFGEGQELASSSVELD
jgi:hypothetical protein